MADLASNLLRLRELAEELDPRDEPEYIESAKQNGHSLLPAMTRVVNGQPPAPKRARRKRRRD